MAFFFCARVNGIASSKQKVTCGVPYGRASERNFPGGTKVGIGPPNLVAPQALSGAHAVK